MKDSIIFLRKFRKQFPEIEMGLQYDSNFYNHNPNKLYYEYSFCWKNEIDWDYECLKSKNLKEPFQKKVGRNLEKYWAAYQKEQERLNRPRKFIKED